MFNQKLQPCWIEYKNWYYGCTGKPENNSNYNTNNNSSYNTNNNKNNNSSYNTNNNKNKYKMEYYDERREFINAIKPQKINIYNIYNLYNSDNDYDNFEFTKNLYVNQKTNNYKHFIYKYHLHSIKYEKKHKLNIVINRNNNTNNNITNTNNTNNNINNEYDDIVEDIEYYYD